MAAIGKAGQGIPVGDGFQAFIGGAQRALSLDLIGNVDEDAEERDLLARLVHHRHPAGPDMAGLALAADNPRIEFERLPGL